MLVVADGLDIHRGSCREHAASIRSACCLGLLVADADIRKLIKDLKRLERILVAWSHNVEVTRCRSARSLGLTHLLRSARAKVRPALLCQPPP